MILYIYQFICLYFYKIRGDLVRIGVFVGSFDPIHIGHIKVMDYLIDNNYLDKIIILPTLNYWKKQNITNVDKRVEMIKKIKRDYIIIDNINNKYAYTYQILESLHNIYKKDEIYLIISADNIIDFHKWVNVESILNNNKVIVLNRNNIDINKYVDKFIEKDKFIVIEDFPFIDISSTELRNKINKDYLDEEVYNYIIENKLYEKE